MQEFLTINPSPEAQRRAGVPPVRRSRDGCAAFDRFMAPLRISPSDVEASPERWWQTLLGCLAAAAVFLLALLAT
jgi:hypothetical protein